MIDFLTIHKNMLGATTSGTSFNSSRSGSSKLTSHASEPSSFKLTPESIIETASKKRDPMTTPPKAVGFHSSSGESWTVYFDRDGNKYNSIEEYQAEMKRQEEERKRQEEAAANGHNHNQHDRGSSGNSGNGIAPGGDYNFSLGNENNSEDDNTLLYAILAGIGIVGVAFLAKKNKNKNKKKKK